MSNKHLSRIREKHDSMVSIVKKLTLKKSMIIAFIPDQLQKIEQM